MERSTFGKKLTTRVFIYAALSVLAYGALAHFFNPATKALNARADAPITVQINTKKPFYISYNPQTRKAVVSDKGAAQLFITPAQQDKDAFWESFKQTLLAWHHKPYLILGYIGDYARLRAQKATNMPASDFIMLSLDLARLEPGDFIVQTAAAAAPAPTPAPGKAPARGALVVEVLNASGRGGLAADVTRYLRALANAGEMDVDVITYANYPTIEPRTKLIDNSGRQEELKKLGHLLGRDGDEIFTTTDAAAIADARLILGKDFIMPKPAKK